MDTAEYEWAREGDVEISRTELNRLYERGCSNGPHPCWERSDLYGLYRDRIEAVPEDRASHRIRVTRSLALFSQDFVTDRHLLYVLLGFFALTFSASPVTAGLYLVVVALLVGPKIEPPLSGIGDPINYSIRPIAGLYLFAAVIVTVWLFVDLLPRTLWVVLLLISVGWTAVYLLSYDAVPGFRIGEAGGLVRSHLRVLSGAIGGLLLAALTVGAIGAIASGLTDRPELLEAIRGGASDGVEDVSSLAEIGALLVSGLAFLLVAAFLIETVSGLLSRGAESRSYPRTKPSGISKRRCRVALGIMFAIAQAVGSLLFVVVLSVLLEIRLGEVGATVGFDRVPFITHSSPATVETVARTVLGGLPVVPGETMLFVFLGAALLPVATAAVGTGCYAGYSLATRWSLLMGGESLETSHLETAVPVDVRSIDYGDAVFARPVSVGFGRKHYVVITEAAMEALSEEELDAVVLHGSRQLASDGWLYGLVSLLFGMGGGGRNLLLTVRDYESLERTADRYALENGVEPATMADAIETLWTAKDASESPRAALPSVHPTFAPEPAVDSESASGGVLARLAAVLSSPTRSIRDVYAWYFGPWIIEAVRTPVVDRHARLSEQ